MNKTRRWLWVPLLALPAYLGVRWIAGDPGEARDQPPQKLFDRVWMEKVPDDPKDYLHGSYVLESQPFGLFQRSSAFDFHIELFQYDRDGNKLKLTFPQSEKQAKISYAIKSCDDMPPFDLCLTLSANPWGGPVKYYGFADLDDEAKALPGAREALAPQVAAAARAAR